MTVADTSIQALEKKLEEGSDLTDRQRCFKIIKEMGPITMEQMETSMGKPKHTFTGRIRELKDKSVVEVVGTENGHQLLGLVERSDVDRVSETGDEWVSSMDNIESSENTEGLFKNDEQPDVLMKNGEIV